MVWASIRAAGQCGRGQRYRVFRGGNDLLASLPPPVQDGTATISVNDPASGGFSQMTDALTYGAAATDLLLLLLGSEPSTR